MDGKKEWVIIGWSENGFLHPQILEEEKVKAGGSFAPARTLGEAMWPGARDVTKPLSSSIHQPETTKTLSDRVRAFLDRLLWPVSLPKDIAVEADSGDSSHIGFFRRWRMNMWKK